MEREEGELSDEDLEDVSDNSSLLMVPTPIRLSGKSPSLSANREPFRELSLTSISDESDNKELRYRIITTRSRTTHHGQCRKHKRRKEERNRSGIKRIRKLSERRIVHRKNSIPKDYSSVSSSSDESDYYQQDEDILRQLREAVRINRSQQLPNCSLRKRLKRMIEPDSQGSKNSNSEDDNDIDTLRDLALQSKSKKEIETPNVTDKDLIELRLIALQSAVLKKHQNRRKNKEQMKKVESETNMEQQHIDNHVKTDNELSNSLQTKTQNTISDNKNTDEEDEAILRAMLLSKQNKNIIEKSNKDEETKKSDDHENEAILRAMFITNIYNNNTNTVQSNQENISDNKCTKNDKAENTKSNIDDDEDILRAILLANMSKKIATKKSVKLTNDVLKKNNSIKKVNEIASKLVTNPSDTKNSVKVPSVPVNRFIINLNSDSDSDCDNQKTEKKKTENSSKKSTDLFDKSLSLFLQQARAKSDAEYKSDISHLPKSQQLEYRRLKRKLQLLTKSKLIMTSKSKALVNSDENKLKLINTNLKKVKYSTNISNNKQESQSALKTVNNEKQLNNKMERFQVKGKYEELASLMAKVSDARIARDKAQAEVKRLINDLRVARSELTSTHQTYTVLMQQLVKEKSLIDKRLEEAEQKASTVKNCPRICTSTPNKVAMKENPREISCNLSAINENEKLQVQDGIHGEDEKNEPVPEVEDMEIEEDVVEEEKKECSILKYSSPLDHIQYREQPESNPLLILCPYDLLGECRDPDCSFRHCGNAITD